MIIPNDQPDTVASFIDYFHLYLLDEGQLPAEVNPKLLQVHGVSSGTRTHTMQI